MPWARCPTPTLLHQRETGRIRGYSLRHLFLSFASQLLRVCRKYALLDFSLVPFSSRTSVVWYLFVQLRGFPVVVCHRAVR